MKAEMRGAQQHDLIPIFKLEWAGVEDLGREEKIAALKEWLPTLAAKGIELVPVKALLIEPKDLVPVVIPPKDLAEVVRLCTEEPEGWSDKNGPAASVRT